MKVIHQGFVSLQMPAEPKIALARGVCLYQHTCTCSITNSSNPDLSEYLLEFV